MPDKDNKGTGSKENKILYCSFCGKGQNEVRKLIAGPSVYICDECVDLCNNIIEEELSGDEENQDLVLYKLIENEVLIFLITTEFFFYDVITKIDTFITNIN